VQGQGLSATATEVLSFDLAHPPVCVVFCFF
jgi:hypothetical protein